MGIFWANLKASHAMVNGNFINASGTFNKAHPLEVVHIAHKIKISINFLEGFNEIPIYSTFKNKFDSKAPFSKVVRTPQVLRCVKPVKSGAMTLASISSRLLRSAR